MYTSVDTAAQLLSDEGRAADAAALRLAAKPGDIVHLTVDDKGSYVVELVAADAVGEESE